ncbi:MAG TPA: hypothetical protein VH539_04715 [Gemmatimonadaceae bacterium]
MLIGLETNHSYVVVPSSFFTVARSRPFETSTISLGTVMAIRWLSGSSARRSLVGHQTLAPISSFAVAIQWRPRLSRVQTKPPSHGARRATRGLP